MSIKKIYQNNYLHKKLQNNCLINNKLYLNIFPDFSQILAVHCLTLKINVLSLPILFYY